MINGLLSGKIDFFKNVNYLTFFFYVFDNISTGIVDNILLYYGVFLIYQQKYDF